MAALILATGCKSAGSNETKSAVESSEQSKNETGLLPEIEEEPSDEPEKKATKSADGIDVDLTELSSTMVYSEVYNMMYYPENYVGKKVKMSGTYAVYHDDKTDKTYHACIITDATACCSQGIEFELADSYKYPDDYPEANGQVCIAGTFETYKEGEITYCTLKNAKMMPET